MSRRYDVVGGELLSDEEGREYGVRGLIRRLVGNVSLKDVCTLVTLKCAVMCNIVGLVGFTRKSVCVINTCLKCTLVRGINLNLFPSVLVSVVFYTVLKIIVRGVTCGPLQNTAEMTALVATVKISCLLRGIVVCVVKPRMGTFPATLIVQG